MNSVMLNRLGKRAYVQSLKPYNFKEMSDVAIFGLDSEYVPRVGFPSELISWQMAWDEGVSLFTTDLSLDNLYRESCVVSPYSKTMVFVVFFSLAEIQFFNLVDWQLSEYKGKYRLKQEYKGRTFIIIDLYDWYPKQSLAKVAALWGLTKLEYPIGKKVEAIAAGELTVDELLADEEFLTYAKNDAVLCQRICTKMREYFLDLGVDMLLSLTPAQTSAYMFRSTLPQVIDQHNTHLRKLALQCCWGGRMECLYRGTKEQVWEYDATGHHPNSAIALGILPEEKDWRTTNDLHRWLAAVSGVGMVHFRFPDTELYPCLPVFHHDTLIFPLEGVSCCSVTEAKLAALFGAKLIPVKTYYYNTGTSILADYLQGLQDQRNASEDAAYKQLLKLLSNSIIGKLFQKRTGVDLSKVQKYADEHKIPYEQVLRIDGLDFGQEEMSVGSCFYPEWYSLILGYARTTISNIARENTALVISSDSFAVEKYLGETLSECGITYNLKASGKYVAYRTRFYRIGDKYAHHAVHSLEAGKKILENFLYKEESKYSYERIVHLKEAWKMKLPFGSRLLRNNMKVALGFDYKRRLLPDGTTVPWRDVEERDRFLESMSEVSCQGKLLTENEFDPKPALV